MTGVPDARYALESKQLCACNYTLLHFMEVIECYGQQDTYVFAQLLRPEADRLAAIFERDDLHNPNRLKNRLEHKLPAKIVERLLMA